MEESGANWENAENPRNYADSPALTHVILECFVRIT